MTGIQGLPVVPPAGPPLPLHRTPEGHIDGQVACTSPQFAVSGEVGTQTTHCLLPSKKGLGLNDYE